MTRPKYFKVKTGFEAEDSISITQDELEKAIYAQITGKVAIFRNGTIRGNNIISITEDWHTEMGYNKSHVLEDDDFAEISQRGRDYRGLIAEAKMNVDYLIDTNQTHLVGKNIERIEKTIEKLSVDTSEISNKFKIS